MESGVWGSRGLGFAASESMPRVSGFRAYKASGFEAFPFGFRVPGARIPGLAKQNEFRIAVTADLVGRLLQVFVQILL